LVSDAEVRFGLHDFARGGSLDGVVNENFVQQCGSHLERRSLVKFAGQRFVIAKNFGQRYSTEQVLIEVGAREGPI
jgi:hypothetical protein